LVIGLTLLTCLFCAAKPASVASINPDDLVEYNDAPEKIRGLIEFALGLTEKELGYTFGSNSPDKGGLDCSGTVQHTLTEAGVKGVPRSSYRIYQWANDAGKLTSTRGVSSTNDPVFENLQPGDLLFWEGTYATADRIPPISHVKLYLGTSKKDGKGVVFGASNGRRFRGKKIHGVCVFDWVVPSATSKSRFVAYGPVPGLRDNGPD